MTLSYITSHSFARHRKQVDVIGRALHALDSDLKAIARDARLQPGDRDRQAREARAKADATVRQARAELDQALAEDLREGRRLDVPTSEALQRRAYHREEARADLEGLRAHEAMVVVQRVVEGGDAVRSREYVKAARVTVGASPYAAQLKAFDMDTTPAEERAHATFRAGIESFQGRLGDVDRYTADLTARAGQLSDAQRLGWAEQPDPIDTRILYLWVDGAERGAGVAGERKSAELDRREPADWARPGVQERAAAASAAGEGSDGAAGAGEAS